MSLRICFIVNDLATFHGAGAMRHYLPADRFAVTVMEDFPGAPASYDLIVPLSFRRVLPQAQAAGNVVVFHSSNLPEGRGWAPLYQLIAQGKSDYVICGLLAADEVDAGDIVVRATFPILPGYTATWLRGLDEELMFLLTARLAERFAGRSITGLVQSGAPSYWPRRTPDDSRVDPDQTLRTLLPHLRAVEPAYPAFFEHDGVRYEVCVRPVGAVARPTVQIHYLADDARETWCDWLRPDETGMPS